MACGNQANGSTKTLNNIFLNEHFSSYITHVFSKLKHKRNLACASIQLNSVLNNLYNCEYVTALKLLKYS